MRHIAAGAALSYRALFTWLNPVGYLSSRIIRPIGLAISFAAVSSYYGTSIARPLVGASLLAGAHAVIYGMALSVGNERNFGTMDTWLGSPQNILGSICQRALPHLADGFISGGATYLVCCALYGVLPVSPGEFVALLLLSMVSAFGLGILIAGLCLTTRDVFIWPNVAHLVLMLLAGVLVSVTRLPAAARPVADGIPLSHVMNFVTGPGGGAAGLRCCSGELTVAVCWFAVGALVVGLALRRRGRRLWRRAPAKLPDHHDRGHPAKGGEQCRTSWNSVPSRTRSTTSRPPRST